VPVSPSRTEPAFRSRTSRSRTFAVDRLSVALPNGRALLAQLISRWPPRICAHDRTIGIGKSTLFRAFAGIGRSAAGRFVARRRSRAVFAAETVPRPGKLRDQVTYPAQGDSFTDGVLNRALARLRTASVSAAVGRRTNWAQVLSGGNSSA